MENTAYRAIAIVGAGAVLPDAPDVPAFWTNVKSGRYSITEVNPDRWDPALYYDPDPAAPDKTYSKIGGWVREHSWDPMKWHMAIPPRVVDAMDDAQKWAISSTREALADYGYPGRPLDTDRTAVILGNAMAGEKHYLTAFRAYFPEYARELKECISYSTLPEGVRRDIARELHHRIGRHLPEITEDSMPGELANCIAGRIANIFNFHGPNYVTDAACASAMAAISSAAKGLIERDFDVAITGGIDRNMGAPTFIKFCKIGALSGTGTRPYAEGADGFVMGEGVVIFILKRLADAERDGDRIYAVLRGIGGSSDGKGKGITAPNPIGQKLCIERAWVNAGISPGLVTLMEGHGTSTRVGDVVEVNSMAGVLSGFPLRAGSVALGSVKSNIGHLKGAAGAAGLLKTILALRDRVLPPSVKCDRPNPDIDFAHCPLYVNRELKPWTPNGDGIRRAGVSAFGFGGTNFHMVVEEHIPHRLTANGKHSVMVEDLPKSAKPPLRGTHVVGAPTEAALVDRLRSIPRNLAPAPPSPAELGAPERIAIDYADAADLVAKSAKALHAFQSGQPAAWRALRAQGIFRGSGPAPKVAFLFTGQGSQYINMLRDLRAAEPIVARTFDEADRIMTPLLGKPLSEFIFIDAADPKAVEQAEADLRQTAITQPAVLTCDIALTRLLAAYGIRPDMTMGHSLGEYGALVAAGALPFADALEAVSARGREMTRVSMADNGRMAAVFAPLEEIERILKTVSGYVVVANINSATQAVIGGASGAVAQAVSIFQQAGYNAVELPVSHAFHTEIVAPASEPLRRVLERMHLTPARIPTVTNVTGRFYPAEKSEMLDTLARQIASPVQFVQGLHTLYQAGARVFVEVGPKKALHGFVEDVLPDALPLFTNHPKFGDIPSFNQALCGLYAAGLGDSGPAATQPALPVEKARSERTAPAVTITGASLGLPGEGPIFDDSNVARILRGEQFIDVIPTRFRRAILEKNITRLVKSDNGNATFERIDNPAEVLKLAARGGSFDLSREFGVAADRLAALDRTTQLAIAAGLDALRDAGIPLVLRYKTTSIGSRMPDRWGLPDALRDDTGVIFASVFPGFDSFARELARFHADEGRRQQLAALEDLRSRAGDSTVAREIDRRIADLRAAIEKDPYLFDRRFLFRTLSMGHSQFAELIGARGPNTQLNSACASTAHALAVAEDWIRAGRCRRVVIVSADDITTDSLIGWFGAGFLASGTAATDAIVEDAAIPFDRRRHGMIMGMGAAALVVESREAARERGLLPICEVVATITANSAFHGTRLDVEHIGRVMEAVIARAEAGTGVPRRQMAREMVFVSHETYTPARGGSASAEIHALRKVFGDAADEIVIANTKGYTGHAMGTGIEDVVAVKVLETGCVPPVANFKEVDPELGPLNLSKGGCYPVRYALRLGAGFGSQISMTLSRWVEPGSGVRANPNALGYQYRIADQAVWNQWLGSIAGGGSTELEVVNRTLRVRHSGAVVQAPQPEPAVAAVETPAPPAPAAAVPAADDLADRILEIVAEKTGYPKDMLALDLDLEADLGIDTVKQAEMFASVRAAFDIPRDTNMKLRDFPTLAHVIRFARDRRPAEPVAPAVVAPAPAADDIKEKILDIVAEKTGYPKDMLDLDLDLEADLGIDTVKQAEMFASVRAAFHIPRDTNMKLRDFPTLAHVIRFAREGRPAEAAPTMMAPAPAIDDVKEKILDIVAEKTGYPKDMLDLDLDLEADLGIDTVKQAEMFASVRAAFHIPRDTNMKLRDFPTLAHVIRFARGGRPVEPSAAPIAVTPPAPAPMLLTNNVPRRIPVPVLRPSLDLLKPTGVRLGPGVRLIVANDRGGAGEALTVLLQSLGVEVFPGIPAEGTIHGVFWLPALDYEGDIGAMDLAAWREALQLRVKSLYATMRALPPECFLISATRLGGRHGYDEAGAFAPLGGAVTGFTKAYKRERPTTLVKCVDFSAAERPAAIAHTLMDETMRDPGAVEIGRLDDLRWTIGLREEPFAEGQSESAPGKDSVFLVTGAAGSIVSAIVADLAAASGATFHLLDLAPEPDLADPDLQLFATDRDLLKRNLFARVQARGERATPVVIEKQLAAIERAHAARSAMHAVRAAGGAAYYYSVDLTDSRAVAEVIDRVRERSGRIDVLLHAAGIERSHLLPDKDPREFDLVFDVKADGWFNLLSAIGPMPLRGTVAFSSIAGRFGNAGQTDYSAANDLLCKIASGFRSSRPATHAVAIDWTAWGEIGMATRGSIPKVMELAGIDMLPPSAGIPWIRRELIAGTSGEVVVAQKLGVLAKEWDSEGGIDVAAKLPETALSMAISAARGSATIQTDLDPAVQAFLYDHQIDGTPVLPGVMGVEAFAEAATSLLPGWNIDCMEDVNFLAPFKFYRGEPRKLTIEVSLSPDGEMLLGDCRLTGSRVLSNHTEAQVTTHFTSRLRATRRPGVPGTAAVPAPPNGAVVEAADIYRVYFHGPAYQVVRRAWLDGSRIVGEMAGELPPNHRPDDRPTVLDPRVIELCFQTAGLWEIAAHNRMGLPYHIDRIRFHGRPGGPLFAVVTPRGDGFDAVVVDRAGNLFVELTGYRTAALPDPVNAEPLRALMAVHA
jgi:malonyl CoA-acyl carrier protein transacylase